MRSALGAVMVSIILIGILGMPCVSRAQSASPEKLSITEIMYDLPGVNTGRQWIEIANTGIASIDLGAKDIRLLDGKGNHLIKGYGVGGSVGSTMLGAGAVAVIAQNPEKFLQDWPSYNGMLLKSSFSLTSSGTISILHLTGASLSSVQYSSAQGSKGDGNSLQRPAAAARFVPGRPTPGTFPAVPPAPLVHTTTPKPSSSKGGSSIRTTHAKSASSKVTSKSHAKNTEGSVAPAGSSEDEPAGALSGFKSVSSFLHIPDMPLFSSPWLTAFLALFLFSAFSLMVTIQYV